MHGFSLPMILLIIFITLKLAGVISWSWWLVLAPLWISLGAFAFVVVIFALVAYYVANV